MNEVGGYQMFEFAFIPLIAITSMAYLHRSLVWLAIVRFGIFLPGLNKLQESLPIFQFRALKFESVSTFTKVKFAK